MYNTGQQAARERTSTTFQWRVLLQWHVPLLPLYIPTTRQPLVIVACATTTRSFDWSKCSYLALASALR